MADFCGGRLSFELFAGENHVDFYDTGFEIDVVFVKFFEEFVENFAGSVGALVDSIIAIVNDFRFDNGDDAGFLAFFRVVGKVAAVFGNGVAGGGENFAEFAEADFKGGTPFGEAEAHIIIFF